MSAEITLPLMPAADALDADGFPLYRPETMVRLMREAQRMVQQSAAVPAARPQRRRTAKQIEKLFKQTWESETLYIAVRQRRDHLELFTAGFRSCEALAAQADPALAYFQAGGKA